MKDYDSEKKLNASIYQLQKKILINVRFIHDLDKYGLDATHLLAENRKYEEQLKFLQKELKHIKSSAPNTSSGGSPEETSDSFSKELNSNTQRKGEIKSSISEYANNYYPKKEN